MNTNYEKDLNELKEQILEDGNTLVSKKDLLERFCEVDKEYNSEPWNLLQILANINILVGEEPSKDAINRQAINELFNSEIKMYEKRIESRKGSNYHDETERIREFRSRIANAEYWNDKIKSLPPAMPTRKKGKWIKIGDRGFGVSDTVICKCSECEYKTEFRGKFDGHSLVIDPKHAHKYCPSCGLEMENAERIIFDKYKEGSEV
jgi:hypothetical protein